MASNYPPLWSVVLRKEALDLMVSVWPELDDRGREQIIDAVTAGPPEVTTSESESDPQQKVRRRDRRVFERLALLQRLGHPPLPDQGITALDELRLKYPQWDIEPGDRAHFSVWTEKSTRGQETDLGASDLVQLSGPALHAALRQQGQERGARLELWSDIVRSRPGRGLGLLMSLTRSIAEGDEDIWHETLYGLREAVSRVSVARRLIIILSKAPQSYLYNSRVLSSASDVLEMAAKQSVLPFPVERYWDLWDRLFDGCLLVSEDVDTSNDDWLITAINHPVGSLTTALLDLMFRQGLKSRGSFPTSFQQRLDRLVAPDPEVLRLARVILASRLIYIFAVDPHWTKELLLPYFSWQRSEEEAAALWRGYGATGRINADLWAAFEAYFFETFTPERLARIGRAAENLACVLMIAGTELAVGTAAPEKARTAVRGMTDDGRQAAISVLVRGIQGSQVEQRAADAREQAGRADHMWSERIRPWIHRVWPRETVMISPGTSEQFAMLAISTDELFPQAVNFLLPYMMATSQWGPVIHSLRSSSHPSAHPVEAMQLVYRIVRLEDMIFTRDLRSVLDAIANARPDIRRDISFRSLDGQLRAIER